jgi:hypothetical protein|tara:strand:- start:347 stop:541 length:195 start_codon:yes stop_codon:yes gene_type:complete
MAYYYYDHYYGKGETLGDFGKFMDFIDESYDKDRHTVQDSLNSHKQCCKDNDFRSKYFNTIEDN